MMVRQSRSSKVVDSSTLRSANHIAFNGNIYETIELSSVAPGPIGAVVEDGRLARGAQSSASLSQLDDHLVEQRPLLMTTSSVDQLQSRCTCAAASKPGDCNESGPSTHKTRADCQCSFRRRYPNDPIDDQAHCDHIYSPQIISSRPAGGGAAAAAADARSDICRSTWSAPAGPGDAGDHYKVPAACATTPTPLNEEFNQVIERERERTLQILRARQAPRASLVELGRAADPNRTGPQPPHHNDDGRDNPDGSHGTVSPAPLSDYDNLSAATDDGGSPADSASAPNAADTEQLSASNSITGPPSTYLNTLSLASDPLDGLTHEDYSIVNQLDCCAADPLASDHSQLAS